MRGGRVRAPSSARLAGAAVLAMAVAACVVDDPAAPEVDAFSLERVAEGLVSPVALASPPDGSGRLFVVEQSGSIRVITAEGGLLFEPFLDLSDRMVVLNTGWDERGFLGLAFHPGYAVNGRFFVYYSAPLRREAPGDWDHTSHLSEFRVSSDPNRADPASERLMLPVDQPHHWHNAGALAFGPDGMLYVALGDGGHANDVGLGHVPGGNAQDPSNLLGSILRIDVNGPQPYGIPPDNPFVGRSEGRDEVWAYGFRNPYRMSFDRLTGTLILGDVGQNRWEEVNVVTRGGNYGWNRMEGWDCFDPDNPDDPPPTCDDTGPFGEPLVGPVITYLNARAGGIGVSVIGGYVYRGRAIPDLTGRYVFGDFSESSGSPRGRLFMTSHVQAGDWDFATLEFPDRPGRELGLFLKGFGEDEEGEIYVLTSERAGPGGNAGRVYRLVRSTL